jgi:hypothetical protein
MSPKLGRASRITSPLQRLALGIARARTDGEFILAIRLQARSALLQEILERVRTKVGPELDVRFVGRVRPLDDTPSTKTLRSVCRPLVIGCSVGHIAASAGTLGLIALHRKTGRHVIVSNSHVLAQAGQAKLGDAITQPGRVDGGGTDSHVGALLDFAPLKTAGSNHIDAAIAVVDDSIAFEWKLVPGIGAFDIPDEEPLTPGQKVMKVGRTTGLTHGEITVTELDDIVVDYERGTVVFDDQIEVNGMSDTPFSRPGDSGSLVIDENRRAIGLLFSGNPAANDGSGVSYSNPLLKVMAGLDVIRP